MAFPNIDIRLPIILCDCLTVNRLVLSVGLAIYARVIYPNVNCTKTKNANINANIISIICYVVFVILTDSV